jgi:lysozyme family protein
MPMSQDLARALKLLARHEGGWSNHPDDRGGATNGGVTQATYDAHRRSKGLPARSVALMTQGEHREIYDAGYWRLAGCDRLPWPFSYLVFDAAVNSGPSRGVRWLQQGLGVPADGKVGPQTVAAAEQAVTAGDVDCVLGVVDARRDFLVDLVRGNRSQLAFLGGWWRRLLEVQATALADLLRIQAAPPLAAPADDAPGGAERVLEAIANLRELILETNRGLVAYFREHA